MIPKIKNIIPIKNYRLQVKFDDGKEVIYDVKKDIEQIPCFAKLINDTELFDRVQLDQSRTCVFWSDEIDLPSDAIYEYGTDISTKQINFKGFEQMPEKLKKVAFICVHNSCRSQIAEALGRHLAKDIFESKAIQQE